MDKLFFNIFLLLDASQYQILKQTLEHTKEEV